MLLSFLGFRSKQQTRRSRLRRPLFVRPWLESLEERCTPTVLTVTNPGDSGTGTLRDLIGQAHACDTIQFKLGSVSTITLTSPLTLNSSVWGLTIQGPGASQGDGSNDRDRPVACSSPESKQLTIQGDGTFDLFDILTKATISGLTLTRGYAGIHLTGSGATGDNLHDNVITQCTDGVLIDNGANSNLVGSTSPAAGNTISNNVKGVVVKGDNSIFNEIIGNLIYGNSAIGIDLGDDGITVNTPGAPHIGPNNLGNVPVLISADGSTVSGVLNRFPNSDFLIEFFAGPSTPSTVPAQGEIYLGSTIVTTDAQGNTNFTATVNPIPAGMIVVATATNISNGNTSEFSAPPSLHLELDNGGGSGQSTVVQNQFVHPLTVHLVDVYGNGAVNQPVVFHAPTGGHDPGGTFPGGGTSLTVLTDASGTASAVYTANTVAGEQTVTASYGSLPPVSFDLTNASSILWFVALQNVPFTGTVATFSSLLSLDPLKYQATIDWGDGSTDGDVKLDGNHFDVTGSHTYRQEGTYPVVVTITYNHNTPIPPTLPSSAMVLPSSLGDQLIDADVKSTTATMVRDLMARSQDLDAHLFEPNPSSQAVTLLAATFTANPEPQPFSAIAFHDLRVIGGNDQGQLMVVFHFDSSGMPPELFFWDGQSYQPVAGSTLLPNSMMVNQAAGTLTVTFDHGSLTYLVHTVFALAAQLPPTPVSTVVAQQVALGPTAPGQETLVNGNQAAFGLNSAVLSSTSQVSLTLFSSQDQQRQTSQAMLSQKEPLFRFAPLQGNGSAADGPDGTAGGEQAQVLSQLFGVESLRWLTRVVGIALGPEGTQVLALSLPGPTSALARALAGLRSETGPLSSTSLPDTRLAMLTLPTMLDALLPPPGWDLFLAEEGQEEGWLEWRVVFGVVGSAVVVGTGLAGWQRWRVRGPGYRG